ncbi:MAG: hypothetical protein KF729_27170 [Sandaracinaceae bacterium]|nr:hypothetical protein [Sandaracinaceae bacterium]
MTRALPLLAAALLAACSAPPRLVIELRTDLTPGLEFTQIVTHVSRERPGAERDQVRREAGMVVDVAPGDPRFLDGVRVADLPSVPPGLYWVEVLLRGADGAVVATGVLGPIEVVADTARTVRITRDCRDVECPGSGPPAFLACLQGRCVDPRCSPEEPEYCPPVTCETDPDCAPPAITCADTRCVTGTCFVYSTGARCPDGSYCHPDVGCVPDEEPPPDCLGPVCSTGDECVIGRLDCEEEARCLPWAVALPGSACRRGECAATDCLGLPLEVEVEGAGHVVSEPAGVDCAAPSCVTRFERDTRVTLLADAPAGSTFVGWTGDCERVAERECVVAMTEARRVRARFEARAHRVTVVVSGTGAGRVDGGPIACGATCSVELVHGATIELDATPDGVDDAFGGWGGACAAEPSTRCRLTVTEDLSVGATFIRLPADVLRVVRDGTGSGTVTSAPAGIDCGGTCAAAFMRGAGVTLTAVAAPGSTFAGWADDAASCTMDASCPLVIAGPSTTARATFTRIRHRVTVERVGAGTGTVRSDPAGIDCGATCSADFDAGSTIRLTPVPATGSVFAGWELVPACMMGTLCSFSVGAPTLVRARFERAPVTLTVTRTGAGSGAVREDTMGALRIDCGSDCSETLTPPATIRLLAVPAVGSTFAGWTGGGCAASGNPCAVSVDADTTVSARFDVARWMLDVTVGGGGTGNVVSVPAGAIDCGSDCGELYTHGTLVTLEARPAAGSFFAGWSGACSGMAPTCVVTMDRARTVGATFSTSSYTLSAARAGTGAGVVRETSPGSSIDCGAACSASYAAGTMVTLAAAPDACSDFVGWSAPCAGTGPCTVTVSGPTSVTATFTVRQYVLRVTSEGGAVVTNRPGDPSGIACPTPGPCMASYACGATALLEARCGTGAMFTGWSVPACGSSTSCDVLVTANTSVTARCAPIPRRLVVAVNGGGLVVSETGEIDCGAACSATYPHGQSVTLVARESDGWCFSRWATSPAGACGSSPVCALTMTQDHSVEAIFERCAPPERRLEVRLSGTGHVVSETGEIDCGGTCSARYPEGTPVTLIARAPDGWCFTRWATSPSSTSCSADPICMLTMSTDYGVEAIFERCASDCVLEVSVDGSGRVTSMPAGVACPGTCELRVSCTTDVVLEASPADELASWMGDCIPGGAAMPWTCRVVFSMGRARVLATFRDGGGV